MSSRKSISKKMRFEVFKRDSFKCQYCGQTSPDVVLEVDHIKPVSEGGANDITNLITACFDCNRGKTNILLDDNSVLEKQRKQLESLNERRNQLEMMMNWREGLLGIENDKISIVQNEWEEITNHSVNDSGLKQIKTLIKKYDLNLILDCLGISANQYLIKDDVGDYTEDSVEKAFNYIGRIAANKIKNAETPYMNELFYLRGIMRNRYSYVNEKSAIDYLKEAYELGATIESLKDLIFECNSWTAFRNSIERFIGTEG